MQHITRPTWIHSEYATLKWKLNQTKTNLKNRLNWDSHKTSEASSTFLAFILSYPLFCMWGRIFLYQISLHHGANQALLVATCWTTLGFALVSVVGWYLPYLTRALFNKIRLKWTR